MTRTEYYKLIDTLAHTPRNAPGRKVLEQQLLQMKSEIERADAGSDAVVRESDTVAKIVLRELSMAVRR